MINQKQKITEIIRRKPVTARVFYNEKIDFCFDGRSTLEDSCAKNKIDVSMMLWELESVKNDEENLLPLLPGDITASEVIAVILNIYHEPLKRDMDYLEKLALKIDFLNGYTDGQTSILRSFINKLFKEIREHMNNEEFILFPLIKSLEDGTLSHHEIKIEFPVWQMEIDHENANDLLKKIRWITDDFKPAKGSSASYQILLANLDKLEFDLYQHIYLENNILHPIAIKLEKFKNGYGVWHT